ncbi:MAG: prepilin-type N-terminal cleavage/methylation domain-containing protein [Patescibacteria group bacterium]
MKKLDRKGFTLIEILVVVAIIGILAGVVLVGLRGTGPQARDSRRAADLRQVQNGLELYYNKNSKYPEVTTWTALRGELVGATANLGISNLPEDPVNDTATSKIYSYAASTGGTSYVLRALLEEVGSKLLNNSVEIVDFDATFDCSGQNYCVQL